MTQGSEQPLPGSAPCLPLAGCALLLLAIQASGNLALLPPRGESTDAFCSVSPHLSASSLLPTFLMWFLRQPCLKGTFSMQRSVRAVFTCHFPSESFISLQPQGPQHQPNLNMGLKLYTGCPQPWDRGVCLCKCARVLCAHKNRCVPSRINEAIQSVTKCTIYGQFQQLVRPKEWGGSALKPSLFCLL